MKDSSPGQMTAMIRTGLGQPTPGPPGTVSPSPRAGQVMIRVHSCGVCLTHLHLADGELPRPKLPLVLGHEIVGRVMAVGSAPGRFREGGGIGSRPMAGVDLRRMPLLPLRPRKFLLTAPGSPDISLTVVMPNTRWRMSDTALPFPTGYSRHQAAPLLCAGLIGYRSLAATGAGRPGRPLRVRRGRPFGGPGCSAPGQSVFAFTRQGDSTKASEFVREPGPSGRAGPISTAPEPLDAAIIFAPVGALVPGARLRWEGRHGGLRRHPHEPRSRPSPMNFFWGERVATLGRQSDPAGLGEEFFQIAARVPLRIATENIPLN